ncbi:uncharacterized protein LOC105381012 [Plutella xylostella]|uniref:uncharacterized protein LOC105381012 n=1 Tax=Plutella xylostella TaxID=51655 RepID=UPI002032E602|nr:uncharacterized protein LOC105381012 [Plutella xylostella]XP_037975809.2 uncharacterized protein LOC105381012 [Plutella xylostella]XP_037975810.2 uncharacterized protein LOC105381012 [Plutella xylostella]XP_048477735.1 uncharacterized protein LOC105381012 [Plutella xylostella]
MSTHSGQCISARAISEILDKIQKEACTTGCGAQSPPRMSPHSSPGDSGPASPPCELDSKCDYGGPLASLNHLVYLSIVVGIVIVLFVFFHEHIKRVGRGVRDACLGSCRQHCLPPGADGTQRPAADCACAACPCYHVLRIKRLFGSVPAIQVSTSGAQSPAPGVKSQYHAKCQDSTAKGQTGPCNVDADKKKDDQNPKTDQKKTESTDQKAPLKIKEGPPTDTKKGAPCIATDCKLDKPKTPDKTPGVSPSPSTKDTKPKPEILCKKDNKDEIPQKQEGACESCAKKGEICIKSCPHSKQNK